SGAPVAASKAKKFGPAGALLPTKTRPPATTGLDDEGVPLVPMAACQRGTRVLMVSVSSVLSVALSLVRARSWPYIGQSPGSPSGGGPSPWTGRPAARRAASSTRIVVPVARVIKDLRTRRSAGSRRSAPGEQLLSILPLPIDSELQVGVSGRTGRIAGA